MLNLTEQDLRFLVETVATNRRDHEHVVNLVRDKEDFLEQMLEDSRLVERLLNDQESLIRLTPYMLFSVFLRAVRRQVQERGYVYEPETRERRVAVFEGPSVVELLSNQDAREYLTGMLCSFVKTDTQVIAWRERGSWHRRRFNNTDMDDMIALARIVEPGLRPRYYQRIGDIALFLSGIFPDQAVRAAASTRTTLSATRTMQDYETEGREFYTLAAREGPQQALRTALEILALQFGIARTALNHLSNNFLREHRTRLFPEQTRSE